MAAIHVVDASGRVSHALPIATLLRASRDQRLRDLSPRVPHIVVAPTLPVREAAHLLSHYGLAVVPDCPYVRGYIEKHAEYQDLVRSS